MFSKNKEHRLLSNRRCCLVACYTNLKIYRSAPRRVFTLTYISRYDTFFIRLDDITTMERSSNNRSVLFSSAATDKEYGAKLRLDGESIFLYILIYIRLADLPWTSGRLNLGKLLLMRSLAEKYTTIALPLIGSIIKE